MKFIILALLTVLSFNAYSGGKIIFKTTHLPETDEVKMMTGLSVYQKIVPNMLAYDGFIGVGTQPLDSVYDSDKNKSWFSTHHAIVMSFSKLEVSPGIGIQNSLPGKNSEEFVDLKLSYKLW